MAPKILAFLAQKGGTGKTTLAVHVSILASEGGGRCVLVDMDPQKSAGDWWRARADLFPELVECGDADLAGAVKAARADGAGLVVIDTAPHAEQSAIAAARAADLVLIPCRPGILDLRAIGASVAIVKSVKSKAAIVLNACPPRRGAGEAAIVHEARQGLKAYGLPVAPVAVTQRAAFAHALIDGRAVTEYEPTGKAAAELRNLWAWIEGEL